MSSIFNAMVSAGRSVTSRKVSPQKLGRERFEELAVLDGDPDDKDGHYYTPALMQDATRAKLQVKHVELLVIDIDEVTPIEIKKTFSRIEEKGYECVRHTTFSHTPEHPKWRLIFKPSRNVNLSEYACIIKQLAVDLMIDSYDRVSLTPYQPMFYPMVHRSRLGTEEYKYSAGQLVDVEPYLMALVNHVDMEEYVSEQESYDPMPIPGALSEANWLESILTAYPAKDCPTYNEWSEVGMALWHQTDGRAFQLWLTWSRLNTERHGRKISEYDMEHKKWPSFKPKDGVKLVTLRTVLNRKTSTSERTVLAMAYKNMIGHITDVEDLKRIRTDIQDDTFLQGRDRNAIATAYRDTAYKCTGERITTGEAMMQVSAGSNTGGTKEFFMKRYLFNEAESVYYDIHTKSPVPITSLNFMYGSHMPPSNSGERKVAHKVLTNESNGYVKPLVMHGFAYEVSPDPIIHRDGQNFLNQFVPASWPEAEKEFNNNNDIDARIEQMISRHFTLLCNGDEILHRMLMQHIGHLRQRPNVRLHFAYAVSSYFHGVGKTTLRHLYETVLGPAQVNVLAANNIAEDFNSYVSAPKLMSFIEEFEFDSRREQNKAIKKMKDLITSDSISVRRMRTDPVRTETYTAYALFSNDEYVLGHEATGRRWVPIIVDAADEQQCSDVLGMPHKQFYDEYYLLMEEHGDRFVAYFEAVSLDGFETERPPMTKQKEVFIENVPARRVMRILQDIIDAEQSIAITNDYVICTTALTAVRNFIEFEETEDTEELEGQSRRNLRNLIERALKSTGYRKMGTSHDRVRLPAVEGGRSKLNDIWIKGKFKRDDNDSVGLEQLRQKIARTASKRALNPPESDIERLQREKKDQDKPEPWDLL